MSKKLIVHKSGTEKYEHALPEGAIYIGRRADCAIVIDDTAISGRHANITVVFDDTFVEDCGSSNGTYVNMASNPEGISRTRLNHNDIITVGKANITYNDEVDAELNRNFCTAAMYLPASPATAATIAKIAEQTVDNQDAVLGVPAAGWGDAPLGQLTITGNVGNGESTILNRCLVTLGRPGKQLAAISRWRDGYFISHISSDGDGKRYPLLNSEPVPGAAKLNNDDKINLVGLELVFNI